MPDQIIRDVRTANRIVWTLMALLVLVVFVSLGDHVYLAHKIDDFCAASSKRTVAMRTFLDDSATLQGELNEKALNAASFWDGIATKQTRVTDSFPLFLQSDAQLQRDVSALRERTAEKWRKLIENLPPIKDC